MPDGEAAFEDFCDGDGIIQQGETEDATFTIRLRVTKRGETMEVDFEGSDPAVPGPMNAPLSVTASGVYCALKMIVDPTGMIPPNSGTWRPITVKAPPGSVVNAQFPSPVVYANHEMSHRVVDMLFGALAEVMPENVMACSQGTSSIMTFGGVDPRNGERYVSYESIKGGYGARPTKDGINTMSAGVANMMNTPIESLEMSFPLRVDYYEIIEDSGGAGRHRGGCGARRGWTVLDHDARATVCMERTKSPPFGIQGGEAGGAGAIEVEFPDGTTTALNSKGAFDAPAGSRIRIRSPGSGGFGDPRARDPELLASDIANGYVTEKAARDKYGAGS